MSFDQKGSVAIIEFFGIINDDLGYACMQIWNTLNPEVRATRFGSFQFRKADIYCLCLLRILCRPDFNLLSPVSVLFHARQDGENDTVSADQLNAMIYEKYVPPPLSFNRRLASGLSKRLRPTIAWMVAMLFCVNVSRLEAQTTEVASDDFNRPDGPIGSNWSYTIASQPFGSFSITNGLVVATLPTNHIEAYWSANSFSPDQYSQASLSSIGPFTGVILRADNGYDPICTNPPSGSQFYMGFIFAPNDYRIYHWINNAYYQEVAGSSETWANE